MDGDEMNAHEETISFHPTFYPLTESERAADAGGPGSYLSLVAKTHNFNIII